MLASPETFRAGPVIVFAAAEQALVAPTPGAPPRKEGLWWAPGREFGADPVKGLASPKTGAGRPGTSDKFRPPKGNLRAAREIFGDSRNMARTKMC